MFHSSSETILSLLNLDVLRDFLAGTFGFIGILVISMGVIKGIYLFALQFFRKENLLMQIRIELGQHLALGLEFLIGKDIVDTIIDPSWDDLGKLGAIIVIRTILSIFLTRELKDMEEEFTMERKIEKSLKKRTVN
ncbi:MAG: DUF1622 domain-containing protein [Candidatus Gracilibacteria bacterium]